MNWWKTAQSEAGNSQSGTSSAAHQKHTIAKGDTLSSIAKKYLGDANRWQEIANVNPGIDVKKLQIGQIINVPTNNAPTSSSITPNSTPKTDSEKTSVPTSNKNTADEQGRKSNDMVMEELRQQLMQNEASGKFRAYAYNDPHTQNIKKSIGYGFHLDENNPRVVELIRNLGLNVDKLKRKEQSITEQQAKYLLDAVISDSASEIGRFIPDFSSHPADVQKVLLDMYYNLGINGFGQFKRMHAAVNSRNYALAAKEMMTGAKGGESLYAKQVKGRASRLKTMMENAK